LIFVKEALRTRVVALTGFGDALKKNFRSMLYKVRPAASTQARCLNKTAYKSKDFVQFRKML
jgi:hypothetical protein